MKILVTGAAGFIGYHVSALLARDGHEVIGLDNLNDYYDPNIKQARLARLAEFKNFAFMKLDLADQYEMTRLFEKEKFNRVVHLGAQAGVRYSMVDPLAYVNSNLVGTTNVLEGCRHTGVEHLVYASTSSVYGANSAMPFSPGQNIAHPLSFYAATKKANELMAHSYSSLFGLPTTGLRFFTVYGPWGRPDMALFKFTKNILAGEPIDIYNFGHHRRDFTYVDDIAAGIVGVLNHVASADRRWNPAAPSPASSFAPYRIYNIGNGQAVELMRYIELLEKYLGKEAKKNFLPLQAGDVPETLADVKELTEDIGYTPNTPVEVGVERFVNWYRDYYGV